MLVPREWLSTGRLSLRPPTSVDAGGVLRILSNRSVVEHNPSDLVVELSEVQALLGRWLQHWSAYGFGNCCVIEKGTGRLVGTCGVRRMRVHAEPVLNLMYRFDPNVWGRGYATEASQAVLDRTDRDRPGAVVLARVRPGNLASQAVARKIGLRRDPDLDDEGADGLDWAFTNRALVSPLS